MVKSGSVAQHFHAGRLGSGLRLRRIPSNEQIFRIQGGSSMGTTGQPGQKAPTEQLVNLDGLEQAFYQREPDMDDPTQLVSFGTSGHRGSSSNGTFTDKHIAAVTQAICDYRRQQGLDGPLFLGKDTHALSAPAERTALEVLAANEVETVVQSNDGFTPTPAISREILAYNRGRSQHLADGIVITPSHNPPADGGFKYNPPSGGPADSEVTSWIQDRANTLLRAGLGDVKRVQFAQARKAPTTHEKDFAQSYVADLRHVIDFDCIRSAGVRIGVDPLGGAGVHYWEPIAEAYDIDITIVNDQVDKQFSFMTLDHDGKIRMDCSSPHAMAGLIGLKDEYDIAFGNDPDADRHGIVTPSSGLLNPNHFLAVAIRYLFGSRPEWSAQAGVGKTLVSSALIDRLVASLGRTLVEVPVGFKWFVSGLLSGEIAFGGEESAGASFLRTDGTVWTTDKDGLILGLLAAEITGRTGKDPGVHFQEIAAEFGSPLYRRIDQQATPDQKAALAALTPDAVTAEELAGEPITRKLTRAPGNNAPIGGLKVVAENGWFAARPSGTENIYKIYAESFRDETHLASLLDEARQIVDDAFGG
jgi:phosphoglucomutase